MNVLVPYPYGNPAAMADSAAPPANPSAIVSGAGTSAANGEYTPRGTLNGKPYYNLIGEPDNFAALSIYWGGAAWFITDAVENASYVSTNNVAFPWLVTTWAIEEGNSPAPGVVASTATVVVSGAGTGAANGIYTYRGFNSGYPYWNLAGQPDSPDFSSVFRGGDQFSIYADEGTGLYTQTSGSVSFPWQDTYDTVDGAAPAPTVTQG